MKRATLPLLLLGMLVPFFGCQESGSADPTGTYPNSLVTRADIDQIRERLTFIDARVSLTTPPQRKPRELQVEGILKRIHPALAARERWSDRSKLLKKEWIGQYEYLKLIKPVAPVLDEITKVTYDDSVDSGFAILQASFWRRVDKLQKEGMDIAFISSSPETIAGIYYDTYGMIGIDLFANSGTLTHELRHAYQAGKVRGQLWPAALESDCREVASAYFGELDSTTIQLRSWIPVIKSLPLMPRDATEAKRIGVWVDLSPTMALSANLDYPVSAAQWVLREESCPTELRDLVNSIVAVVYPQKAKATGAELLELTGLRYEATEILSGTITEAARAQLDEINRRIEAAKQAEASILETISTERVTKLRQLFARFGSAYPEIHEELFARSGGYRLLSDEIYDQSVGE
ncbi:MAG TPA: hypothetical protein VM598_02520 [Bdellovibrionota bacterium]|nr:hypothetical protein [Bdellovibrionota bacterium]